MSNYTPGSYEDALSCQSLLLSRGVKPEEIWLEQDTEGKWSAKGSVEIAPWSNGREELSRVTGS